MAHPRRHIYMPLSSSTMNFQTSLEGFPCNVIKQDTCSNRKTEPGVYQTSPREEKLYVRREVCNAYPPKLSSCRSDSIEADTNTKLLGCVHMCVNPVPPNGKAVKAGSARHLFSMRSYLISISSQLKYLP